LSEALLDLMSTQPHQKKQQKRRKRVFELVESQGASSTRNIGRPTTTQSVVPISSRIEALFYPTPLSYGNSLASMPKRLLCSFVD
jgi:hypothetical protein